MEALVDIFGAGLSAGALIALLATSFLGSFITVALGIGGGALLLAFMATLMPPAALIPVHGVIQLGSNATRAAMLWRDIHWSPVLAFTVGTVLGAISGGLVVVELHPGVIQIGIGLFVIWSVFMKPPAWLSGAPGPTGAIASFLTMFFGATGLFVANYVKSLTLPRAQHVATHATLMTMQHLLKILVFAVLGFAFAPWLPFMAAMILTGFLGTVVGRSVLLRMSDKGFKRALDILLVAISLRLIWSGVSALG